MSRVLIVYFSRTGATRRVAAALATTLHADVEEIIDRSDRSGTLGTLRCVLDSVMGRSASIEPMRHDLSAHHMVVIGTPVWAGRVSAPVRAGARVARDAPAPAAARRIFLHARRSR
ncbi:flavodoxin [Caballeronia terrestris]|uniref:Flavodoxin n=1 Tax=Caballeronia terrestris TaxID=1226301 RepID=A0A158KXU4_9BURK|nr:NAD(P)H-dependent oxidoreductase [Caballeronia terrestris]SAL85952.1 flavodoxin [Caballeronia terrestris]